MSKWITGKDVARRLNLKDFEIFDYLASGELKPYSSVTGKKIKWYDFNRNDYVEARDQKSFFNDYLFLKSDIESFELAHGTATKQAESIIDTCEAVKAQGSNKPESIAVVEPSAGNFIKRINKFWTMSYEGKQSGPIKDVMGLRYIAYLLERPGDELNSMDLYHAVNGNMPDAQLNIGAAIDDGLNVGNTTKHEINDYEAKLDYKNEIQKLWQEYNESDAEKDTPEKAMIQKQILQKIERLTKESNERAFPTDIKKKQTLIRNLLKTAYKNIKTDRNMKTCVKHLEQNITTDGKNGFKYIGGKIWEIFL